MPHGDENLAFMVIDTEPCALVGPCSFYNNLDPESYKKEHFGPPNIIHLLKDDVVTSC